MSEEEMCRKATLQKGGDLLLKMASIKLTTSCFRPRGTDRITTDYSIPLYKLLHMCVCICIVDNCMFVCLCACLFLCVHVKPSGI